MTDQTPEYDEPADPAPATITDLDTYEEAGPGSPTAEDLAADSNLYPTPTDDSVPDGSQLPDEGVMAAEIGDAGVGDVELDEDDKG